MDNQEKNLAQYWTQFLQKEFQSETDRGAVVLTVALFENALTNILKKYLVPTSSSEDELFDMPHAPISSFSAKVKLAERLGLISTKLARDLNIVRKIRNEFAHNIHGSSFNSGKIKDWLTNLTTSSSIVEGHKGLTFYPAGVRGDFLKFANIVLYHLHGITEDSYTIKPINPCPVEWIYSYIYIEKKEVTAPIESKTSSE